MHNRHVCKLRIVGGTAWLGGIPCFDSICPHVVTSCLCNSVREIPCVSEGEVVAVKCKSSVVFVEEGGEGDGVRAEDGGGGEDGGEGGIVTLIETVCVGEEVLEGDVLGFVGEEGDGVGKSEVER